MDVVQDIEKIRVDINDKPLRDARIVTIDELKNYSKYIIFL